MVLAAVSAVVFIIMGIIFLGLFVVSAIRRFGLVASARFYQRSIWLGGKRLDATQLQQLLVLIDKSQERPRLIFEVTDKTGKTRRFPLDPSILAPDMVEKVAADIQAFGSRHYSFPVEVGTPTSGTTKH